MAVALAVLAAAHLAGPVGDMDLRLLARHSARLSFALFLPAFVAGPLCAVAPGPATRWMLRRRRHLGLAFALAHFFHLGALVAFFVYTPAKPEAVAILAGGLGYAALAALTLTSSDRMMRNLGRHWKTLHRAGVWYLWFIFTVSYLGRVAGTDEADAPSAAFVYQALLVVTLAAAGLRMVGPLRRRMGIARQAG